MSTSRKGKILPKSLTEEILHKDSMGKLRAQELLLEAAISSQNKGKPNETMLFLETLQESFIDLASRIDAQTLRHGLPEKGRVYGQKSKSSKK